MKNINVSPEQFILFQQKKNKDTKTEKCFRPCSDNIN